jgi:hypothetical protein
MNFENFAPSLVPCLTAGRSAVKKFNCKGHKGFHNEHKGGIHDLFRLKDMNNWIYPYFCQKEGL